MEPISVRIARCIDASGLTKTSFAQKIGLTQAYVSALSIGRKSPSDRTIMDICREFNICETWLRTGEGEMFNKPPSTLSDKLAQEYGLDDFGRQIMAAYLELGESDRLAVGRLIHNIMNQVTPTEVVNAKKETASQVQPEPDLAQKIAELERQNQEKDKLLQEFSARLAAMEEEDGLGRLPDTGNLA